MKVRLIRRRGIPSYWQVQERSFFAWHDVDGFHSFENAMKSARDLLDGKHPRDIIEIVAVRNGNC